MFSEMGFLSIIRGYYTIIFVAVATPVFFRFHFMEFASRDELLTRWNCTRNLVPLHRISASGDYSRGVSRGFELWPFSDADEFSKLGDYGVIDSIGNLRNRRHGNESGLRSTTSTVPAFQRFCSLAFRQQQAFDIRPTPCAPPRIARQYRSHSLAYATLVHTQTFRKLFNAF